MDLRRITWLLAGCLASGCNGCDVEEVEKEPGTLRGTVCHQVTGRPSIGAVLTVQADKGGSTREYSTTSDRDGRYSLVLPPGTHSVQANGEGVHVNFSVVIQSAQTTQYNDPTCIAGRTPTGTGCVAGQLCNRHTGTRVENAEVTVILSNVAYTGESLNLTGTTNDQGVFQICGVPTGNHTVHVRSPTYQKAFSAAVTARETVTVATSPTCERFDPAQYCSVVGRVCMATDPPSWLSGARVTAQLLNPDDTPVSPAVTQEEEEFTDATGSYELFLKPAGRWRVQAQKGNFVARHIVECQVGQTIRIEEGTQCVSASGCRFLAVQGQFDRVEDVLTRVGVDASRVDLVNGNPINPQEDWAFGAFGDMTRLEGYCGIFFNCGINESAFWGPLKNPTVITNLKQFVQQGGTLYASDQSYDVVEALFPEKVDWLFNDDLGSGAEYGLEGLIHAAVHEPGLLNYLQQDNPGQTTVDINFVYQRWSVIMAVDPDVQVFLKAHVQACADGEACTSSLGLPDTPLTIRFPVGEHGGQVVFTSFHVETGHSDAGMGPVLSTVDTDKVMRYLMTL